MSREVRQRYVDPLAEVWLGAARRIGLTVERSAGAYASTDGGGTMVIGTAETLDADDSLAQMIFHELCHSLVQGEASFEVADWGLDNVGDGDFWREHATLRLQKVLAGRYGLARFFAPTTEYRAFWDALPADPLADRADRSVIFAIAGLRRLATPPWGPHVEDALAASAAIVGAATAWSTGGSLSAGFAVPPPHPTGLPAGFGGSCGECAWRGERDRCRQAGLAVDASWPACERFEAALDCQTCGACCREAYGAVVVGARDLVRKRRPDYVVDRGPGGAHRYELRRAGERCAALGGGDVVRLSERTRADSMMPDAERPATRLTVTGYACAIYDDRPRTCRDFTLGSAHCLTARRRVGLSL